MRRERITNADQAVAYLMSLVRKVPRPYAARAELDALPARALLERVGNPHTQIATAHIAGSKGKGSTALYLEAVLESAGRRTGTFTSPHLERWTERFRAGGRESTPAEFAAAIAAVEPHAALLHREQPNLAPSFFDVLTAAAFVYFAEQRVDCAIVETGIGGTLDATNVAEPRVACITSIELEHTDKLGRDVASIAAHKAGIIKPGVPVIVGRLPAEADAVIGERAAALGSPVRRLGTEIGLTVRRGSRPSLSILLPHTRASIEACLGHEVPQCMAENAALAVACAECVIGAPRDVLAPAVSRALPAVRIPARMEVLEEEPWMVVDGAHTHESIRELVDMLSRIPARQVHLLVSLSAARDPGALLAPLQARVQRLVATRADPLRSLASRRLASSLVSAGWDPSRVRAVDDPRRAVIECRSALGRHDLLCVTGSMYMAGIARGIVLDHRTERRTAP